MSYRRESFIGNHKRLLRLYREKRLMVRRHGGRKRALGTRAPMLVPQWPNDRWSVDFVADRFIDGSCAHLRGSRRLHVPGARCRYLNLGNPGRTRATGREPKRVTPRYRKPFVRRVWSDSSEERGTILKNAIGCTVACDCESRSRWCAPRD
jgi:hypothetical protein